MSNVSRSVYQRCKEENKRLRRDIRALVVGLPVVADKVRAKYYDQFMNDEYRYQYLAKYAHKYFKENPEQGLGAKVGIEAPVRKCGICNDDLIPGEICKNCFNQ